MRKDKIWPLTVVKLLLLTLIFLATWIALKWYEGYEESVVVQRSLEERQKLIQLELSLFRQSADILSTVLFGNEAAKTLYRLKHGQITLKEAHDLLWHEYMDDYRKLSKYYIHHMQFHTFDGRSILRLHQPQKYGDSLLKIRPSVAYIVKSHKPQFGFEFGRYLGAFRAVYPLFYKNEYVGSIEFSYDFQPLRELLKRVDPNVHYFLAFDFKQLKKSVNFSEFHRLRRCYIDSRFVIQHRVVNVCRFIKKINYHRSLLPYRSFGEVVSSSDHTVVLQFIPLRLIGGQYGGYFIAIDKDPRAVRVLHHNAVRFKILIWFFYFLGILAILSNHFYRRRTAIADLDPLSGVYNRRGCMKKITHRHNYGVIFFDIDNFKVINDRYGHDMGDEVIKRLVESIHAVIRRDDIVCRYGGDEFVIFLYDADLQNSLKVAEKILNKVRSTPIKPVGYVTLSIGVTEWRRGESFDEMLKRVDTNLYRAKREGKNRIYGEV